MFVDSYINLQWDRLRIYLSCIFFFFFSSRRRHTRYWRDWSSDVCSSDLNALLLTVSFLKSEAQLLTDELTLENYGFVLSRRLYLEAIVRTFAIGIAVGLIDILLAYPLAYFLVRTTSRWKGLLIALSLAPLLASVVVRTYGWYVILNRFGVANDVLLALGLIGDRIPFMPSSGAITIGLAHALLPYAVLTVMGGLDAIHPNLERAAMSLGASRLRTFLAVTLPLSMPGVI